MALPTLSTMAYMNIKRQEMELIQKIGSGGFSSVFKAKCRGHEVAAKRLNDVDKHEVNVLSTLDHPNIVKLIGVVEDKFDMYLILELCNGGSLRSHLDKYKHKGERLSMKQVLDLAQQAAKPIQYLNQMKVVHKDVKSPNYLIADGNVLKLADFGLAKKLRITTKNATDRASHAWMAPELMRDGVLSPKYDIHSYGVVVWEICTTEVPFDGVNHRHIIWRICENNERPLIPSDCPVALADLMSECWHIDWHKRPSIDEILVILSSLISAEDEKERSKQDEVTVASSLEHTGSSSWISAEDGKASIQDEVSVSSSLEHAGSSSLIQAEDEIASKQDEVTVASSLEHAGSSTLVLSLDTKLLLEEKTSTQDVAGASYLEYAESRSKVSATEKVSRQRSFVAGPWVLERKFRVRTMGTLNSCGDIAVNITGNRDIAVIVEDKQVQLHTSQGEYKHNLDTTQALLPGSRSHPWNVTVSSKGYYYVTDRTAFVKVYDVSGVYTGRWVAIYPDNIPSDADKDTELWGLAIDDKDQLLVGVHCHHINYISRHRCDGSHIASIKVDIKLHYLAATLQKTVVVSDCVQNIVNIIDINTGQLLHTVLPPTNVKSWNPWGICCCDDIIYICNMARSYRGIYCFSVLGEYIGHIATGNSPQGITFVKESNQLFVSAFGVVEVYYLFFTRYELGRSHYGH